MHLSKCVIKFFSKIQYDIYSQIRMYFKLILDLIFILLNLFCLIFSVIITVITSIPHHKAVPLSFLTFCSSWLMTVKLSLQLFIKVRRLRVNGTCSPQFLLYSNFLPPRSFFFWMTVYAHFNTCHLPRIKSNFPVQLCQCVTCS